MDIGISIVVTFVLVLVNGYFSMSEMALVNAKHVLLQKEADEGDARAARALGLAQDSGQFLATIQVAITLVGFFASAAAATNLSDPLAKWMQGFGIDWLSAAAPVIAPVFITLVVSYLSIVVGELVPKRMALADPERVSQDGGRPPARVPEDRLAAGGLHVRLGQRPGARWASRTATRTRAPRKRRSSSWWPTTTSCWKTRSA